MADMTNSATGDSLSEYPIRLYIENSGNEHIGGFTIPLPATREELQPFLDGVEAKGSGDVKIQEISCDISWLGEKMTKIVVENTPPNILDELNYLAARVKSLGEDGLNVFGANIEAGKNCGSITEMINLTFAENLSRFDIQPVYNIDVYGEFLVDTLMRDTHAAAFDRLNESRDPDDRAFAAYIEDLEAHVDKRALGRAAQKRENGVFTDYGYLTGGGELREIYKGVSDIPNEYRLISPATPETDTQPVFISGEPIQSESALTPTTPIPADEPPQEILKVLIYNEQLYEETGHKEFASVWLSFPATQETVQAALKEIGVDGKNYSRYLVAESTSDIKALNNCVRETVEIDELNYLSAKLRDMNDAKRDVFCALVDGRGGFLDGAELIYAADNVGCYCLYPPNNAEDYGEFLLNIQLEEICEVAAEFYGDYESEGYKLFTKRIDLIEEYIDIKQLGRDAAQKEGGHFTDYGYIIEDSTPVEHYKSISDIPAEYRVFAYPDDEHPAGLFKIENTDLSDFIYKLHILAGDYTGDIQENMRMLSDGIGKDYIVIMNDKNIRISDAESVYQGHADINAVFGKFLPNTREYMLHIDNREDGRAFGSIVMVRSGELSEDVSRNGIAFTGVTVQVKDSLTLSYTREQWENIESIDHDKIQDLRYIYEPDSVQNLTAHREEFFRLRLREAEAIDPGALLDYLNAEYMAEANYSQPGMIRIPQETARVMLLNADAPVYRLTPRAPEQLSIITAAKNGLNVQNFREFAIKKDDREGIEKLCKREIGSPANKPPELDNAKKRDKTVRE